MKQQLPWLLTLLLVLFISSKASAQYGSEHVIAPSPWQYWSDANEIVITTLETGVINATISKSDGTELITLALMADLPAIYRFEGAPLQTPRNNINTVYNDRGIIVTATGPVSVNVRNIASDAIGAEDVAGNFIKGNAALVSYGNEGKGTAFRLGYYRNNYTGLSGNAPVYSVLATENNTVVTVNSVTLATLNTGQSYLFNAPMGALLTSDKPVVVNSGAYSDAPGGCADGVVTQVIPLQSLGQNYVIIRGNGTPGTLPNYPEQSTIIATQPNTVVTINNYNALGALVGTVNQTLAVSGSYYTFHHGDAQSLYSSSYVQASKPVTIYSGSGDLCEVDMSTVIPVGDCTGSKAVMTHKYTAYNGNNLDAFGYIIIGSATEPVLFNGSNLETLTGTPRTAIGTSGYYLLKFTNTQVGNAENYLITSNARMTVSVVQQGNGFTMSGYFSAFNSTMTSPIILSSENCATVLTTTPGMEPYQWYLNGELIAGATAQTYNVPSSGNYTVTGTTDCGSTNQSSPLFISSCSDLSVVKEISGITNGNIVFTITASNAGPFDDTAVKVNDLLPSGYTFISAIPSAGTYNANTGIWDIGALAMTTPVTIQITALVIESGNHTNIATISGTNHDTVLTNNTSQATPTPALSFTKASQQPIYYNIGDAIVYDFIITNTGNIAFTNVNIFDANADAGSVVPSSIASLAIGASITATATHTITAADMLNGNVTNQAMVIADTFQDMFIRVYSDDPSTVAVGDPTITPVTASADLTIVKTDNESVYIAGTEVTYTITVTNNGPGNAINVVVNDAFPAGITAMNWSSSQNTSGSGELNETIPTLTSGTTVTYTVTIAVPSNYTGNLSNTAVVTSDTPDPTPTCTGCTDLDTQYIPQADLVTVKTDDQEYYTAGSEVTYSITVTNNGPDSAANVIVNDGLPLGITTMSWSSNLGTSGSGTLNETIPVLANGNAVVYNVTINVPATFTGDLINTAVVGSDTVDPMPNCDNCTDIDQKCVSPNPDCVDFTIPKGISPNGDTRNDSFDLSHLPEISKLEIFNRYGTRVFAARNYTNQWKGQTDDGKELPTGTYYYVVYFFNDIFETRVGWIYINK